MATTKAPKQQVDVEIAGGGTVYLFQPLTQAAQDWIAENVVGETTYFAGGLAVEHRYAANVADGMRHDGLVLELARQRVRSGPEKTGTS